MSPLSASPRVLIVDDNELTRLSLAYALQEAYEVHTSEATDDAYRRASQEHFEAILLDINFHGADAGLGLLQQLRALPAHAETPIIAITAHALPGDAERFLKAGFDAYLGKPFTMDELLKTLQRYVSAPPA